MASNPKTIQVRDAFKAVQTSSTLDALLRVSDEVAEVAETVNTASVEGLEAGARDYLCIVNSSFENLLGFSFGAEAELYAPGTKTLKPGETYPFQGDFVPSNAVQVISDGQNVPFTIWYRLKESD